MSAMACSFGTRLKMTLESGTTDVMAPDTIQSLLFINSMKLTFLGFGFVLTSIMTGVPLMHLAVFTMFNDKNF
jgi:hypothetical protein